MPPSAPSPGRTSATVRRSGRQLGASGALATSRGSSPSASVITRTSRSRIRSPPTNSSPFGLPANRVAPPPARMAPRGSGAAGRRRGGSASTDQLLTRREVWIDFPPAPPPPPPPPHTPPPPPP